jgi:hypothetical protein
LVVVGVTLAFSGLCLVVTTVSQRPRVDIDAKGFRYQKLFGCQAHQWEDIDGPCAVIQIGWSKAVAYKLAKDYRARAGTKPTAHLSGYDEAIVGVFAISAEELAELLNRHCNQSSGLTND